MDKVEPNLKIELQLLEAQHQIEQVSVPGSALTESAFSNRVIHKQKHFGLRQNALVRRGFQQLHQIREMREVKA
jgi:hypothetical protein